MNFICTAAQTDALGLIAIALVVFILSGAIAGLKGGAYPYHPVTLFAGLLCLGSLFFLLFLPELLHYC